MIYYFLKNDFENGKGLSDCARLAECVANHTTMPRKAQELLSANIYKFLMNWERFCLTIACYEAIFKGEYTQIGQITFINSVTGFILAELSDELKEELGVTKNA